MLWSEKITGGAGEAFLLAQEEDLLVAQEENLLLAQEDLLLAQEEDLLSASLVTPTLFRPEQASW